MQGMNVYNIMVTVVIMVMLFLSSVPGTSIGSSISIVC